MFAPVYALRTTINLAAFHVTLFTTFGLWFLNGVSTEVRTLESSACIFFLRFHPPSLDEWTEHGLGFL
jgi:hypothetical protein